MRILFSLLLLLPCRADPTCVCQNNGSCTIIDSLPICTCPPGFLGASCEDPAQEISEQQIRFNLTDTYSLFYDSISAGYFSIVQIIFCFQQNKTVRGQVFVEKENQDGSLDKGTKQSNVIQFENSRQNTCYKYEDFNVQLTEKKNKERSRIVIGIEGFLSDGSELGVMSIRCRKFIFEGSNLELQAFLFIGSSSIMFTLVLAFVVFSRLHRNRQRRINRHQEGDPILSIDHFSNFMPPTLYSTLQTERGNEPQAECSICIQPLLVDQNVRKTPCHHIFHVECIDSWCITKLSCPVCRQNLTEVGLAQQYTT